MVYLNNNSINQVWLAINEWSSLSNPTYLWKLQNSQGRDVVYFIPKDVTNTIPSQYANKYKIFEFGTLRSIQPSLVASGGTDCNIYLNNENQYWLSIWEQPFGDYSLDPSNSTNLVYNELAYIYRGQEEVTYTGNTSLNQPNTIYYSKNIVTLTPTQTSTPTPTPSATPAASLTPTQTETPTQTPTNTNTPTTTNTPTNSGTPTNTPTNTSTSTQTPTPSITQSPTPLPPCVYISFTAIGSACIRRTLCNGVTNTTCYSNGQGGASGCIRVTGGVPQYTITSGAFNVVIGGAC